MTDFLRSLNPDQRAAATATEGYVRVIAGAGSGKTRALTCRYAYLVKAAGIHPSNVLCVTFTNKAAGEMKRRVRSLVGDGYDTSLITTYHGFCVRVLREDIHRLFYPKNFVILDEQAQRRILSEIYGEMEIKLDRATFESILETVHRLKSNEDYVDALINGDVSSVTPPPPSPVRPLTGLEITVVRRYLEKQRKSFGLDFDDLVSFAFAIFRAYPEVLEKWADRLYYIQVDEFQDSSRRELRLLRMLSAKHRNLFVVGDPDQNIYEWRGADVSILVDFDKLFPGTETILMNRNYRSDGNILSAANALIAHNRNRIPKDLWTASPAGAPVIALHAKTEIEEGKWIAGEIRRLLREEGMAYRDIALLYRAGFLSRFLEQSLMQAGIPYELWGSVRFWERMEIRDTLAYLRLLLADDDEAFERIANTPRRSFGRAKLDALKSLAAEEGGRLYPTLRKYLADPLFARTDMPAFVSLIEEMRAKAASTPVSDLMQEVLDRSGYERYIREQGSMERLDNLAECKRSVWEREQSYGEFYSLPVFLQEVALESDRDAEEDADRVKLMTIHASKGLEFPAVFVCGLTEGIFPSGRTLEERKDAGLEEERRLCFVAMTRAMRRLILTESEGTGSDRQTKRPSRFLADIGEEHFTRIGTVPKDLAAPSAPSAFADPSAPGAPLGVGSPVEHPIFGRGVVQEIDPAKGVYYILFEKTMSRRPVSMDYDFTAWKTEEPAEPVEPAEPAIPAPGLPEPEDDFEDPDLQPQVPGAISSDDLPVPPVPEPEPEPESESEAWDPDEIRDAPGREPEPPSDPASFAEVDTESPFPFSFFHIPANPPPRAETIPAKKPAEKKPKAKKPDDGQIPMQIEEPEPPAVPRKYQNEPWNQPEPGEENLWKRDDVPHSGWECTGIVDLGSPSGICRMCGHQIIRYVHVMRHPAWYRTVGAGCVCAGRMEGDPEAAKAREAAFKNRAARRETFLKTPLRRSRNGHEYLKYKGEMVTLLEDRFRPGTWKHVLRGQYSTAYPTKEEALAAAFDVIDPEAEN
ncbi:MAG: UvrD-helicase domain-containing protein [Clostridia bacterium]|nr:UvrD-helicase domain-containing protein [Clostridia bacterium]MBR5366245.1 UvrD-helicase domain-containing protein [Clostridia bacterium]